MKADVIVDDIMKGYLLHRKEYINSIIELEIKKTRELKECATESINLYQCNLSEWIGRLTEVDLLLDFIDKHENQKKLGH